MPIPYRYPRELLPVPPIDLKDPTKQPNVEIYNYQLPILISSHKFYSGSTYSMNNGQTRTNLKFIEYNQPIKYDVTYQSASLSSLPNINYIPKDIIDDEIKS
jgi:hypothetical protein